MSESQETSWDKRFATFAGASAPGARAIPRSRANSATLRSGGRSEMADQQLQESSRHLRMAYADPPYIGQSKKHYGDHEDYAGEVDHGEMVEMLVRDYPDGWAISL